MNHRVVHCAQRVERPPRLAAQPRVETHHSQRPDRVDPRLGATADDAEPLCAAPRARAFLLCARGEILCNQSLGRRQLTLLCRCGKAVGADHGSAPSAIATTVNATVDVSARQVEPRAVVALEIAAVPAGFNRVGEKKPLNGEGAPLDGEAAHHDRRTKPRVRFKVRGEVGCIEGGRHEDHLELAAAPPVALLLSLIVRRGEEVA